MYNTNIWHPCSQMKSFENNAPLNVIKSEGSYIYTDSGSKLFDATSSWWCKSLGHRHPTIISNLKDQLDKYEHTIFANTTNSEIDKFSKRICDISGFDKTLYASDGSCAVEIAIKMTIHMRQKRGHTRKKNFACLENAYHGETLATMSVSDCGLYLDPYREFMFDTFVLDGIPYVSGKTDPLWDKSESYWSRTEATLNKHKDTLNCLIVEPICQGAAGMKLYSKDYLNRLCQWCNINDVYVIFDEIMTGVGRLGKMFAYEYLDCRPDFLCLSKGITSGVIPFSVVLTTNEYYGMFYSDSLLDAFLHSHTHSGNVLGASCANSVLDVFEKENIIENVNNIEKLLYESVVRIQNKTRVLKNIRCIGAVVAAELEVDDSGIVKEICKRAITYGILMRPLGKTIYCLPPLNSSEEDIYHWEEGVIKSILGSKS